MGRDLCGLRVSRCLCERGFLGIYSPIRNAYMVYEHPEGPFLTAATTTVLLNMALKIYRRIWPKTSN